MKTQEWNKKFKSKTHEDVMKMADPEMFTKPWSARFVYRPDRQEPDGVAVTHTVEHNCVVHESASTASGDCVAVTLL